MYGFLMKI